MHMNSKVTIAIRCDDTKEAQLLGGSFQSMYLDVLFKLDMKPHTYTLDAVGLSQIFFSTQNLGKAY